MLGSTRNRFFRVSKLKAELLTHLISITLICVDSPPPYFSITFTCNCSHIPQTTQRERIIKDIQRKVLGVITTIQYKNVLRKVECVCVGETERKYWCRFFSFQVNHTPSVTLLKPKPKPKP